MVMGGFFQVSEVFMVEFCSEKIALQSEIYIRFFLPGGRPAPRTPLAKASARRGGAAPPDRPPKKK